MTPRGIQHRTHREKTTSEVGRGEGGEEEEEEEENWCQQMRG